MHIPEYADVSETDEIVFSAGSDELLLELMRDTATSPAFGLQWTLSRYFGN